MTGFTACKRRSWRKRIAVSFTEKKREVGKTIIKSKLILWNKINFILVIFNKETMLILQ